MRRASLAFIILLLVSPLPPASAQEGGNIVITGNAEIRDFAKAGGAGTASNPWIIENKEITAASGHGIDISDTTQHILIRNVRVVAGGAAYDGIRLVNVSNVVIEKADLQFDRYGIHVQRSFDVAIRNSTVRASQVGILLEGAQRTGVVNNSLAVNERDVSLKSFAQGRLPTLNSTGNTFRSNNLSIASGQIGFEFADPRSYSNSIDASNVVNFVPMRWYTHLTGTAASPRVITGDAAQVKGMTNVAQIMCWACSHVRMVSLNASSGTAAGVAIMNSSNVTLVRPFTEGNEAAGIEVKDARNVTVEGASTFANGVGIRLVNATSARVTGAEIAANRQAALVQFGSQNAILASRVLANDDALVLDRTNRSLTEGNNVSGSRIDGIRIVGGRDNVLRGEEVRQNGGAGVMLTDTFNATVTRSHIENNSKGGVVFGPKTILSHVRDSRLVANGEGGIRFATSGPLNRAEGNDLSGQARHIRFTATEQNTLERNVMSWAPGETGIWFDDENAFNNNISTTNLVNGTPVQWHVAVVGTSTSPIVLRDLRVTTPNVTNIAQIMVFKGSYVRLENAVASDGARGVYALRSSAITISGAQLTDNLVGVELRGTLTGEVRGVRAEGGVTGVLLAQSSNVSIEDLAAPGAKTAVEFADSTSKGSVIQRVNATKTTGASIKDPSISKTVPPRGNHLIVDAGLDKRVGAGVDLTFSDAIGVARFGSDRIAKQTWSFGDGTSEESHEPAVLRPVHAYANTGLHVATYTVEMADGLVLTDTVLVEVLPPPAAPTGLEAEVAGRVVKLEWIPLSNETVTTYRVYRGADRDDLTFVLNSTGNTTSVSEKLDGRRVWFAVSAVGVGGEGPLSTPRPVSLDAPAKPDDGKTTTTTPPTTEAKESPLPPAAALLLALALLAAARRRR